MPGRIAGADTDSGEIHRREDAGGERGVGCGVEDRLPPGCCIMVLSGLRSDPPPPGGPPMRHPISSPTIGFVLALLALPSLAADPKQEAIDRDHALTKGRWRIVSLVVNGTTVGDEDARKIVVVNGALGEWEILVDGVGVLRGTSTIDPTTSPKEIDATVTEGDGVGRKTLGIYEAGTKTRRVCYAAADRSRPGDFSSAIGSERTLVVFERVPEE